MLSFKGVLVLLKEHLVLIFILRFVLLARCIGFICAVEHVKLLVCLLNAQAIVEHVDIRLTYHALS